jgi:cation transporter-like permease
MNDNGPEFLNFKEFLPFLIAVVNGALGGCVASIHKSRSKKEIVAAFAIAYAVTGIFGALMTLAAVMLTYPQYAETVGHVMLITGFAGLVTPCALAISNVSAKFFFKQFGLEVEINVKRTKESTNSEVSGGQ